MHITLKFKNTSNKGKMLIFWEGMGQFSYKDCMARKPWTSCFEILNKNVFNIDIYTWSNYQLNIQVK